MRDRSNRHSPLRRRGLVALLLPLALALSGCGNTPQKSSTPTTQATQPTEQKQVGLPTAMMKIGQWNIQLEIARTPDQLETGLMNRDSMPTIHGMIFVFDKPQVLHFWMKNTRIPLDVIFLTADGRVDSIQQMRAMDVTTDTASHGPCQYAIELNLGAAEAAGVKAGQRLDIPPAARAP